MDNFESYANWSEAESGLDATPTIRDGDIFKITGVCDNAANEYAYYERDIWSNAISTTNYPKLTIRWRTSVTANGVGLKVRAVYAKNPTGALAEDGGGFTHETTEASNDTENDMTLLPAVPAVDDAYYFGSDATFSAIRLRIGTQGAGVWTITWEYKNTLGNWVALSDVVDDTNGFKAATGLRQVSFTVPSDWGNLSVDGVQAYWIRGRVSAYTSITDQPLGTRVRIDDGDQTLLPTSGDTPQFSTDARWQVTTGSFTTNKTIERLQIHADDEPDTIDSGSFDVEIDFLMIHIGTFTFPYHSGSEALRVEPLKVTISIPGRVGGVRQNLGLNSPILVLQGNMDTNTSWGSPPGEKLFQIAFESYHEAFQWFTSDLINCKMAINRFEIKKDPSSRKKRVWELELEKVDTHCGSAEWVWDYFQG